MKEEATAFPFCVEARLLNASGDLCLGDVAARFAQRLRNPLIGGLDCWEFEAVLVGCEWETTPNLQTAYLREPKHWGR